MKFNGLVIILACLTSRINGECFQLLENYYNCMTVSNRNDSSLNDSFYKSSLANIKSFSEAMGLFRSIFSELKSCATEKCQCVKTSWYSTFDYELLFTSSVYFQQVYSILNTIKTEYRLLDESKIYNYNLYFNPSQPTLTLFCLNYEFGPTLVYFYNQTFECYRRFLVNPKYYQDCRSSYLSLNVFDKNQPLDLFKQSQLENYFGCVGSLFQPCDTIIRRAILLGFLAEAPDVIQGGNLDAYLDYLSSLNVRPSLERNQTFYDGKNLVSLKNGSQICDLEARGNYTFLNSSRIKIYGKTSESSVITELVFIFMLDEFTEFRFIWPNDLDPLPMLVNASTGQQWLQFVYESDVVIIDFLTNSSIRIFECESVDGCKLEFVSPMLDDQFGLSGLLVNGCGNRQTTETSFNSKTSSSSFDYSTSVTESSSASETPTPKSSIRTSSSTTGVKKQTKKCGDNKGKANKSHENKKSKSSSSSSSEEGGSSRNKKGPKSRRKRVAEGQECIKMCETLLENGESLREQASYERCMKNCA